MQTPPRPANEAERLQALHRLNLLNSMPDAELDGVTRLARRLVDVPVSAVSLIDADRQVFKSIDGLDARETRREVSFCAHTITEQRPLVVPNAQADPRFRDNPLVRGEPHVLAYAGQAVHSLEGHALGALCVIDHRPHEFSAGDVRALEDLAMLVEQYFQKLELDQKFREIAHDYRTARSEIESLFRQASMGVSLASLTGRLLRVNWRYCNMFGYREEELLRLSFQDITHPDDLASNLDQLRAMRAGVLNDFTMEKRYCHKDGGHVWASTTITLVRDAAGNPQYIIACAKDINARKQRQIKMEAQLRDLGQKTQQLEAELEQQSIHRQRLLERIAEAYLATDAQGIVSEWNRAAEQLFGWPREDVLGRCLTDFAIPFRFRQEYRQNFECFLEKDEGDGANRTRDLILQRRDGNEFPATLLVVSDRIGGEWMVSFFVRDRSGDDGTGMPA